MEDSNVDQLGDKTTGSNDLIRGVSHDHGTTRSSGQVARAEKFGMS
jgi:hypothetical protein